METEVLKSTNHSSGASRMRAGQGICALRQRILGHFRPSLDIVGAKGLFKDTFLFEGRGCIPPPPFLDTPLVGGKNIQIYNKLSFIDYVR